MDKGALVPLSTGATTATLQFVNQNTTGSVLNDQPSEIMNSVRPTQVLQSTEAMLGTGAYQNMEPQTIYVERPRPEVYERETQITPDASIEAKIMVSEEIQAEIKLLASLRDAAVSPLDRSIIEPP